MLPASAPGTAAWLLARVGPRVELQLRNLLRGLEREADARLVSLHVVDGFGTHLLEFAGDDAIMPTALPWNTSSVPSFVDVRCRDRESRTALVHRVRLGRGMPRALLVVLESIETTPALVELAEDVGARIEEVLVATVESEPERPR